MDTVFALYKCGDMYKVFINERGDTSNKLVFNELASEALQVWTHVLQADDKDELASSMCNFFEGAGMFDIVRFIDNMLKVPQREFGTYKQWRFVAYINEQEGTHYMPKDYTDLKNFLDSHSS